MLGMYLLESGKYTNTNVVAGKILHRYILIRIDKKNMYKVTRDNIRTYEDKLSGNDDKLQQNPKTTSWFVDKDEDDQEYTCIYMAS